ncbi:bacteriohemerythrin [Paucidesulfovibrio longus]|uniref:bacteriohemerythrin n=1 Tax=Paucidesulfovibrio longus TaxID=889 RepID=UPI0003B5B79D|nr:bacteriohemerythrin [Paucidesulfovibrio longus]
MVFAEWNEGLSVGDEEIDGQHKWLFFIINRLVDAIGQDDEERAVVRCMVDMERYALTHFSTEEAYMESLGYPGLAQHRLLHLGFAEQVENFREALILGEISAVDVADYLKKWLVAHIQKADGDIARTMGLGG